MLYMALRRNQWVKFSDIHKFVRENTKDGILFSDCYLDIVNAIDGYSCIFKPLRNQETREINGIKRTYNSDKYYDSIIEGWIQGCKVDGYPDEVIDCLMKFPIINPVKRAPEFKGEIEKYLHREEPEIQITLDNSDITITEDEIEIWVEYGERVTIPTDIIQRLIRELKEKC